MAKGKSTGFFCQNCGYESAKWMGQCPACREWNTFVEEPVVKTTGTKTSAAAGSTRRMQLQEPSRLVSIKPQENLRISTGMEELDRVLGGGIVTGSLVLVGGDPGIGKSTLLSILMGLEKADEGTVSGMEHQKISVIFQENRLFENLDAVTNIHITTGKTKEEITGFLKKMELDDIAGKPVSEYSGGMKRRVAIARALLAEYDILIMDEPLQGLDAETKEKVATVIKTQTAGKTVLFVTHDEKEAEFFEAECMELV